MSLIKELKEIFGDKNVTVKTVKADGALSGTKEGTISEKMAKPGEQVIEVRKRQSVGHVKAQ